MSALHDRSRLIVPDDVVFRNVVGEAMILHLGTGTYFGLDPVGTRMWQLIVEQQELGAVCDRMTGEFDAPVEQIRRDLVELVEQLIAKRLLQVA